jgi:hypothetical protein
VCSSYTALFPSSYPFSPEYNLLSKPAFPFQREKTASIKPPSLPDPDQKMGPCPSCSCFKISQSPSRPNDNNNNNIQGYNTDRFSYPNSDDYNNFQPTDIPLETIQERSEESESPSTTPSRPRGRSGHEYYNREMVGRAETSAGVRKGRYGGSGGEGRDGMIEERSGAGVVRVPGRKLTRREG